MKTPKKPPFKPYKIYDDEGNEYLVDQPLIPPPKHHKQEKEKRARLAISRNILNNPERWDLGSGYKFARSAITAGFCRANIEPDTSTLRRYYKKVLGMLSCFKF